MSKKSQPSGPCGGGGGGGMDSRGFGNSPQPQKFLTFVEDLLGIKQPARKKEAAE